MFSTPHPVTPPPPQIHQLVFVRTGGKGNKPADTEPLPASSPLRPTYMNSLYNSLGPALRSPRSDGRNACDPLHELTFHDKPTSGAKSSPERALARVLVSARPASTSGIGQSDAGVSAVGGASTSRSGEERLMEAITLSTLAQDGVHDECGGDRVAGRVQGRVGCTRACHLLLKPPPSHRNLTADAVVSRAVRETSCRCREWRLRASGRPSRLRRRQRLPREADQRRVPPQPRAASRAGAQQRRLLRCGAPPATTSRSPSSAQRPSQCRMCTSQSRL